MHMLHYTSSRKKNEMQQMKTKHAIEQYLVSGPDLSSYIRLI